MRARMSGTGKSNSKHNTKIWNFRNVKILKILSLVQVMPAFVASAHGCYGSVNDHEGNPCLWLYFLCQNSKSTEKGKQIILSFKWLKIGNACSASLICQAIWNGIYSWNYQVNQFYFDESAESRAINNMIMTSQFLIYILDRSRQYLILPF